MLQETIDTVTAGLANINVNGNNVNVHGQRPNLEEVVRSLNEENTSSYDALTNHLQELGVNNPSRSYMSRLIKVFSLKRCNSCPFVGSTRSELRHHLKGKDHHYGQGRFANDKRNLIARVKSFSIDNSYLPDVDTTSVEPLSDDEKTAFASLESKATMNDALNATFENILFIGFCLI